MENVLQAKPPKSPGAEDLAKLRALRAEFPGWWIGYSEQLTAWDAKRRRDAHWTGGILMIEAQSAEMLRELLLEVQILDAKHIGKRS